MHAGYSFLAVVYLAVLVMAVIKYVGEVQKAGVDAYAKAVDAAQIVSLFLLLMWFVKSCVMRRY